MKHFHRILLVLTVATIAACKPDPLAPPRDLAYFKANPQERAEVLAKCDADPGQLKEHPNCVNARQAQWDNTMKADSNDVPRLPAKN